MAKASWEREKAYCAKRAEQLKAEMLAAIETKDIERFEAAHMTAIRYMSKKERAPLYRQFLVAMTGRSGNAD